MTQRLIIIAIIAALVLSGALYIRHLQTEVGRQKAKTAVATEQAAGATEATRQLDHYTNTVTVIRDKADAAVQSVQSAPGASESVPDGVLSGWRSAIDGMRQPATAPANPTP